MRGHNLVWPSWKNSPVALHVRGFLGDYDLTVTSGSATTVATTSMATKAGQSVTITLP